MHEWAKVGWCDEGQWQAGVHKRTRHGHGLTHVTSNQLLHSHSRLIKAHITDFTQSRVTVIT